MRRFALLCLALLSASCSCGIHYEQFVVGSERQPLSEQQVARIAGQSRFQSQPMEGGIHHYRSQDIDLRYDAELQTLRIQSSHCAPIGTHEWSTRCEELTNSVKEGFAKAGMPLKPAWSQEQPTEPVLTKLAAMRVAEAVWVPIYGEENIVRQRPFHAELKKGIWQVSGGSGPALGDRSAPRVGGVAYIEIRKRDGKILKVTHGK